MSDPTCLKYKELRTEYDPLIEGLTALAPPPDPTIFDISEYPHYENVISNWYAFFFDPDALHSLHDLFLKSLIEIIKDSNEFDMEGCHVEREFQTDKGGFIDLLLYEQTEESEEDETFNSVIIIENKIYAPLNNDLDDYYKSVKVVESGQKIGIVLSLHKIKDKDLPEAFINITHERLLKVIKRNLGQYVASAKLKYIHTLQDFISNLEQMTRPTKMQDSIKYYFDSDNAKKIDELVNLRVQATNYLKNNLVQAIQRNNYEPKKNAEGAFRFAYYNDPRILFYLYDISSIRTEKKFTLSVWLIEEAAVKHWRRTDGRNRISGETYHQEYQLNLSPDESNETEEFLAKKEYEITDIENFGEEVFEFLKRDWSDFLENASKILKGK